MGEAQDGKRNKETSKKLCTLVNRCQDLNRIKGTTDRLTRLIRTWQCKDIRIVQVVKRVGKVREEVEESQRRNLMVIYSACSKGRVMLLLARGRALPTPPTTVMDNRCKDRYNQHLVGREKMLRKKICSLLQQVRIQRLNKNMAFCEIHRQVNSTCRHESFRMLLVQVLKITLTQLNSMCPL